MYLLKIQEHITRYPVILENLFFIIFRRSYLSQDFHEVIGNIFEMMGGSGFRSKNHVSNEFRRRL